MIKMHKRQMEFWKSKLGISDYGVAWIAFLQGLVIGLLIYHFLIAAQWERYGNSALLTCHCGAVEINLTLPNEIEHVQRCTCSMCSIKYAVFACVDLKNLEVIKGKSKLK